ncbi:uncharacterized protein PAF06_011297 [Gastrophryne carolinensis]
MPPGTFTAPPAEPSSRAVGSLRSSLDSLSVGAPAPSIAPLDFRWTRPESASVSEPPRPRRGSMSFPACCTWASTAPSAILELDPPALTRCFPGKKASILFGRLLPDAGRVFLRLDILESTVLEGGSFSFEPRTVLDKDPPHHAFERFLLPAAETPDLLEEVSISGLRAIRGWVLVGTVNIHYLCSHEFISLAKSLSLSPCTRKTRSATFKSHSHLLSLSLLLLAAGDIAQNPGPFPSPPRSSTPHNSSQTSLHHGSKPANTRNLANLLTITPSPRTPPIVTCALWNARSVCNKLAYIHDLFTTNLFTFMAFTETWLTPSDTASPAALSYGGLQFSHTPRSTNKQGGGVGILLSEYCSFNPIPALPSLTFPSFEVHCVRLYSPCRLNIAIIYRPPGPATLFLDHFSTWLLHFLSSDIPTIIMGDFNIPVDTNNPATTKLLSLTTSFGLKQWSTSSTHKDGHTLDLLFTHLCSVSSVSSSPLPLSDHNLLTLTLTSLNTAPPAYKPAILRRNLRNLDLQSLSDALHPLHTLPSFTNVDAAASYYHNTLTAALDSVAPLNYSRPQAKKRQPWLNTNTATLKRHSRVAERHWRKSKTKEDFLLYKKALQELRTALSSAKQEYFTSLISAQARNPKQLFNTFNSLLRPPPPPPSSQLTAEQFATYFKDKIDQIRSGFTPQNTSLLPTSPLSHSLTHFTVLTAQGVSSLVSKAHLTTCPLDPIPSHLIPQLSPSVIPALTSLFNLSLSTGAFPSAYKHAQGYFDPVFMELREDFGSFFRDI